jgi:hypothetical protein
VSVVALAKLYRRLLGRIFRAKAKLLLVDALTPTVLAKKPVNEGALRSVAVRLYEVFADDPDERFRGCVATLIKSLLPALRHLGYNDFIQGNQEITPANLERSCQMRESKR